MMKSKRVKFILALLLGGCLFLGISGCSMDISNPNAASEEQVLTTKEGILALAVSMQQYYSTTALWAYIIIPGVTARELAINTTFANLIELEQGGNFLLPGNADILRVWFRSLRVMTMAEDLIANVPDITMDAGTRSGIDALARLYKAMALGFLAQSFEQAPIQTDPLGEATFHPRADVFAEAVKLLNEAKNIITAKVPSSEFTSDVLVSGFDLDNSIRAYLARYNLLAGNYQAAIDAANLVDPTVMSEFSYDSQNENLIYDAIFTADDYVPRDSFGTHITEPGDGRLAFYLAPDASLSDPNGYAIDSVASPFFTSQTASIPVYLPGEMELIKAEANLGLGNTAAAVTSIDAIRTKQAADDPFGIGANLPAYSGATTAGALKTEIYSQRRAELFMSGMGWEDGRRLGQPGPSSDPYERNRNFYPYPDQERLNNPNTPDDPAN